jgi:hypothetical protein
MGGFIILIIMFIRSPPLCVGKEFSFIFFFILYRDVTALLVALLIYSLHLDRFSQQLLDVRAVFLFVIKPEKGLDVAERLVF